MFFALSSSSLLSCDCKLSAKFDNNLVLGFTVNLANTSPSGAHPMDKRQRISLFFCNMVQVVALTDRKMKSGMFMWIIYTQRENTVDKLTCEAFACWRTFRHCWKYAATAQIFLQDRLLYPLLSPFSRRFELRGPRDLRCSCLKRGNIWITREFSVKHA